MIEEIADWADAQPDRELIFVIPPTILEMQQSIQRFGLDRLDQRFREWLRTLAPVIDLDFPNKLTRDPRNFSDAYHFNSKVARSIVGEVMRVKVSSGCQMLKTHFFATFDAFASLAEILVGGTWKENGMIC